MPLFDSRLHHRCSIRLKGYDYTQPGAYFVTLCTWQRDCLFGKVVGGEVRLSAVGEIVSRTWQALPHNDARLALGDFVIMPNHLHGIIWIKDIDCKGEAFAPRYSSSRRATRANASPQQKTRPTGTQSGSLGAILQNFKSVSTRKINQQRGTPGVPVWQRNYYDHIIRDQAALQRITAYIQHNPQRWQQDQLHPSALPNRFNQERQHG